MERIRQTYRHRGPWLVPLICLAAGACGRTPESQHPSPVAGTHPDSGKSSSAKLPTPPVILPEPFPIEPVYRGQNLQSLDVPSLLRQARRHSDAGDNRAAAIYQYWAVMKSDTEQYDLACYLARLGQRDAAFYWLQVAVLKDGVDPGWADADADLDGLRQDARWAKVRPFLNGCHRYWATNGKPVTVLLVPDGYDGRTPLPTLVWLHGTNSHPDPRREDRTADVQRAAKGMRAAIVAVSGPVVFGRAKFSWSEEPDQDFRRIIDALEGTSDRLQIDRNTLIPIGFSQGGAVALEVAARHPEAFAGAIAIAPGAAHGSQLDGVRPTPELARRGFAIVCGQRDAPGRIRLGGASAQWLRGAGAKVWHKVYARMGHAVPPDIADRLPEWIEFI
jgi:predicted esterase